MFLSVVIVGVPIVVHVGDGPCVGTMALHFTGTLFSSFKNSAMELTGSAFGKG